MTSTRAGLVLAVFLPESFLELGISLFLGSLAQLPRHHVVITAVRDIGRRALPGALALCTGPRLIALALCSHLRLVTLTRAAGC